MTIEQVEGPARKLCAMRGLDPDENVGRAHPQHPTLLVFVKQWETQALEILAHLQVAIALRGFRVPDEEL